MANQTFIDPICGMTVDPQSAAGSTEHNGTTYYFCSKHCLQKFVADPESFLRPPASVQLTGITRASKPKQAASTHTCPMHPEVRQEGAGSCPKCGMALEPVSPFSLASKTEYTCPMHPEIVSTAPGNCPICGMALEPRNISLAEEANPELLDMTRRFWIGVMLTIPLLLIGMSELLSRNPLESIASMSTWSWIELILATPVVVWCGWPFFARAWQSITNRSLNMFTLIGLGVSVAYVFSVVAKIFPQLFPASFQNSAGEVAVYFEPAAVIVTLVLLGQVLELRARSQTGAAIKALLGLSPKTARRIRADGAEEDVELDQVKPG